MFGSGYAAQAILVAPNYIAAHPATVQRLVNAFVRTMRWVNSRSTLPSYANDDHSISQADAQLVLETVLATDFDSSKEGQWRAAAANPQPVDVPALYTNKFVEEAMRQIK